MQRSRVTPASIRPLGYGQAGGEGSIGKPDLKKNTVARHCALSAHTAEMLENGPLVADNNLSVQL